MRQRRQRRARRQRGAEGDAVGRGQRGLAPPAAQVGSPARNSSSSRLRLSAKRTGRPPNSTAGCQPVTGSRRRSRISAWPASVLGTAETDVMPAAAALQGRPCRRLIVQRLDQLDVRLRAAGQRCEAQPALLDGIDHRLAMLGPQRLRQRLLDVGDHQPDVMHAQIHGWRHSARQLGKKELTVCYSPVMPADDPAAERTRLDAIAAVNAYSDSVNAVSMRYSLQVFRRHWQQPRCLELGPAEGVVSALLAERSTT